jgi:hypothetical protein
MTCACNKGYIIVYNAMDGGPFMRYICSSCGEELDGEAMPKGETICIEPAVIGIYKKHGLLHRLIEYLTDKGNKGHKNAKQTRAPAPDSVHAQMSMWERPWAGARAKRDYTLPFLSPGPSDRTARTDRRDDPPGQRHSGSGGTGID